MTIIKHNRSGSVCPHQPEERRKVKWLNMSVKKRSLCLIQLTSSLELILHFSLFHLLCFSRSHRVWLIAAIKTKNNLHVLFFTDWDSPCAQAQFLHSSSHFFIYLPSSPFLHGFVFPLGAVFSFVVVSLWWRARAKTVEWERRQFTTKKNWRDPETLMRQRILLSPCLCSALLNPPPTVVFSLSQVSSDRWLLSSKKELTDYTRVQEFTAEEGKVGKTFRVSPN